MPFTRRHGIARMCVGVVNMDAVPGYLSWFYEGLSYDLKIEVEGDPMAEDTDMDKSFDGGAGGGDEKQDDIMDHDKRGDRPTPTGDRVSHLRLQWVKQPHLLRCTRQGYDLVLLGQLRRRVASGVTVGSLPIQLSRSYFLYLWSEFPVWRGMRDRT